jgi:hypothetical protein
MDSSSLRRWQTAKLLDHIEPTLGYLSRLRARMQKVGFIPSDPLYQLVDRAYDAVHELRIKLHYLTCEGTGNLPRT